ncbi:MAG TPA: hypothetical protein VGB09_03440 [Candidatus Binatia bacterium]
MQFHEAIDVSRELTYALLHSPESIIHFALKLAEPNLDTGEAPITPFQLLIDMTETLIDLLQSPIDLTETFIDLVKALIDSAKLPIGLSKTSAHEAFNINETLADTGRFFCSSFSSH